MSLNYDLTKVNNFEDVCFEVAEEDNTFDGIKKGDKFLKVLTKTLIFATMSVGLGRITEKNWKKFYTRLSFLEKLRGSRMIDANGPVYIKPEEVKSHIGLSCNVSDESDSKWLKRIFELHSFDCNNYSLKNL